MAEVAERHMTRADFLVWDDGTEWGYEFVAAQPCTMAPAGDAPYVEDPRLVVESISLSTGRQDKDIKVPDYCTLPTVDEIWLIDSCKPLVHVHQRRNGQWIGHISLKLGQSFESTILASDISVTDRYRNTGLGVPPPEAGSGAHG